LTFKIEQDRAAAAYTDNGNSSKNTACATSIFYVQKHRLETFHNYITATVQTFKQLCTIQLQITTIMHRPTQDLSLKLRLRQDIFVVCNNNNNNKDKVHSFTENVSTYETHTNGVYKVISIQDQQTSTSQKTTTEDASALTTAQKCKSANMRRDRYYKLYSGYT